MKNKRTLQALRKAADSIYSLYIRERDCGICVTCLKGDEIKKMQCGHFHSRIYHALRYHEMNGHCQCYKCNVLLRGKMLAYTAFMNRKYTPEELAELKKLTYKTDVTLRELFEWAIAYYTEKLKQLKLKNLVGN